MFRCALPLLLLVGAAAQARGAPGATQLGGNWTATNFPTLANPANVDVDLLRFDLTRLAILVDANFTLDDIVNKLNCKACTWIVQRVHDDIVKRGCSPDVDKRMANLCAALPYRGDWTVPQCAASMHWGCGKLMLYIVNGVHDPKKLCADVFGKCKGPPL